MDFKFTHQFIGPINSLFQFNQKNNNDKTSSFMKFIKKYNVSQDDQKLLFVILFATRFPINKDNGASLIFDIFNNKSNQIKPSQKELDDLSNNLLYSKNNSQSNYFNLPDTIKIYLEELYSNFNGKLDSKMDAIIKDLEVKWNSLIIEDIYKINGKIKTTVLWQLKFGVSNNTLKILQQEIASHKKDTYKLKKLKEVYNNQINAISLLEKKLNNSEPSNLMENNNYDLQLQLELELNRLLKNNQDLLQKHNELENKYNELNDKYNNLFKDYSNLCSKDLVSKDFVKNTYNILDEFDIIEDAEDA